MQWFFAVFAVLAGALIYWLGWIWGVTIFALLIGGFLYCLFRFGSRGSGGIFWLGQLRPQGNGLERVPCSVCHGRCVLWLHDGIKEPIPDYVADRRKGQWGSFPKLANTVRCQECNGKGYNWREVVPLAAKYPNMNPSPIRPPSDSEDWQCP